LAAETTTGFLGLGPVCELNESEPAPLARFPVDWNDHRGEGSDSSKKFPQFDFRDIVRKVSNKKPNRHSFLSKVEAVRLAHISPHGV
jgi:hypothetical protein